MSILKEKLKLLDLAEKEIDTYLAILNLGRATITDISRKTGIKRTSIYEYIENLSKKDLIYKTINKKRIFYCVENPSKITNILDNQKKEIENKKVKIARVIPELMSMYSISFNKPNISFYEGRDGLKITYQQIFNTHKNIYSIFSPESFFKLFSFEENYELLMTLYNNGGTLYSLVEKTANPIRELAHVDFKKFIKSKELPEEFKYETDLLVTDDTVVLISFKNSIGIIIKDKAIAQLQKNFINLIWKSLK